ncbi:MAG: pentapeptide repeat-containing protein [Acidobacteriaceae bacterium]
MPRATIARAVPAELFPAEPKTSPTPQQTPPQMRTPAPEEVELRPVPASVFDDDFFRRGAAPAEPERPSRSLSVRTDVEEHTSSMTPFLIPDASPHAETDAFSPSDASEWPTERAPENDPIQRSGNDPMEMGLQEHNDHSSPQSIEHAENTYSAARFRDSDFQNSDFQNSNFQDDQLQEARFQDARLQEQPVSARLQHEEADELDIPAFLRRGRS